MLTDVSPVADFSLEMVALRSDLLKYVGEAALLNIFVGPDCG